MFFGAPAMIEELPGWAVTVFESTKSEYLATVYAKASLAVRAMAIVDMVISDPQVHHGCVAAAYLVILQSFRCLVAFVRKDRGASREKDFRHRRVSGSSLL